MKRTLKKSVSILLLLIMVFSLFTIVPLTADASSITGFFDCTSGSAEGYFFYRNHFCKIEWTGINTQSTSEVQLFEYKNVRVHWTGSNGESTSDVQDAFAANRRGTTGSTIFLWDATYRACWNPLEVENLIAGQSSSGYTNSKVLAAGAENNNYKKVCTITCAAANEPVWDWSDDFTACTATFTCADEPSLTKTVNASVSTEGYTATASATFNSITYTETITIPGFSVNKAGDTYTIRSEEGWNTFCDCLQDNDTYNRFSGKTVVLDDDITVSRMAGSSYHDFCGTFDGQGNTLTFNYNAEAEYAAPFRYVDTGCVIKNLHVNGTITTDKKYAAGIIAQQYGTVTIRNCRSSVNIQSSVKGDGTHAGLVAVNNKSSNLTIEGCVFDGKIVSTGTGDDATTSCGGFVGWRSGNAEIHNSIFDPAEVTIKKDDSATFARNKIDTYNCYYTYLLNDGTNYAPYLGDGSVTPKKYNNGQQAYTITAGDDVTLGLSGDATEYDVSGITAYAGNSGILYGNTFYAGSGDTVALELEYTGTPEAGYIQNGFTASAGTLSGTTLTMSEEDVTINADFDVESYFDAGTGTLTLKGTVVNKNGNIVLPKGVNKNDVQHINVDSSGATFPQDSSSLFENFTCVTSIDLTGADTSSVTDMSFMFCYCAKLTTIYVSDKWDTGSVTDSNSMFNMCSKLKGGNGTACDGAHNIDKTYAVIDKEGQPGYLTGLFALELPNQMEIATDASPNMKVGSKYLSGAALTFKPKAGYTASNVQANGTELTADDTGVYTVTITDSNVTVKADFAFSDGIGAALAGHSISLEGDIGVNYYTELSDAIANSETAKMHFTIPTGTGTKTQDVSVKDARVDTVGGKTYYVFKCQVAAKEMTSQITAQLIDGDYSSDVFPYSVKEYADYLLEHTDENEDYAKAAPLVKAMLNYGANSQLYFDKNTGNLANAGLTAEDKELDDVAITIADPVIENLPEGTTFEGATLSLKSETTLSLYFKSSDDLTFSCEDYTVETATKGGYQIARIRGIKAADIGKSLTLNVSGGTVSYSPLNYCKYVLADDTQDEKLQNAVKALYLYWQAAAAYFGAPAPDPADGIFFTKVTDESEITRGNISVCTFEEAKAWAIANWDDIMNTEKHCVDIVFSDDNDICLISISEMTDITDFMEIDKPDATGMEIDAIKYYYTYLEEDVYLCGRFFKKVTDESRITEENIGECTFDEAKAWAIANWVDIMKTGLNSVHIVYINDDGICLISISEMTDITDFMESDEFDPGMDIDFIQDLFSNSREDVYLCSPAALP